MYSVPSTANSLKTPMRSTATSTFTVEGFTYFHSSLARNVKAHVEKKVFQYKLINTTGWTQYSFSALR